MRADYACDGGFAAVADYLPQVRCPLLKPGVRAIMDGLGEEETEETVRGTPGFDQESPYGRAALALTLRGLAAIRSREQPGQVLAELAELLGDDAMTTIDVD